MVDVVIDRARMTATVAGVAYVVRAAVTGTGDPMLDVHGLGTAYRRAQGIEIVEDDFDDATVARAQRRALAQVAAAWWAADDRAAARGGDGR